MGFELSGKAALVTGGGRGIGAAIVTRFAEAGARMVIANRSVDVADRLAADLTGRGYTVTALPLKGLSRRELTSLVDSAAEASGRLDIIVHNAGGCPWSSIGDLDETTLGDTLALNLEACFWLAQAAVPHMRKAGGGRILVTSSVTGPRVAMANAAHYAAAKAGVNGFIKAAALELAQDNITVNGVEPGFIAKPGRGRLNDPETMERIGRHIPVGRMGDADDIAYAMLFLASGEAKYVTGQTIIVDGGATLPETGFALELMRHTP